MNQNDLVLILLTKDRLEFLKFRHRFVRIYGQEEFKELLKKANKELAKT